MRKIVLMLVLILYSCNETNIGKDLQFEKIISENEDLVKRNDSLRKVINVLEDNDWFDNDFEGKNFIDKGIENPEVEIVDELRNRADLIPLEAVLGGTMSFDKIQIVSNKWIIASYSDGHISGRSIYEFKLNKNVFEFKIIDSVQDL